MGKTKLKPCSFCGHEIDEEKDMYDPNRDWHNLEMAKVTQMSAVEVLEWLVRWNNCEERDIFEASSLDHLLNKYTPEEIIEKITEYEKTKNKKLNPYRLEDKNEPWYIEEPQFKVGDLIKSKATGTEYTVCEVKEHGINVLHGQHRGTYFFSFDEIEHAEPPKPQLKVGDWVQNTRTNNIGKIKEFTWYIDRYYANIVDKDGGEESLYDICDCKKIEEPKTEYKWEVSVLCDDDTYCVKGYRNTEEEAKQYCSELADHNFTARHRKCLIPSCKNCNYHDANEICNRCEDGCNYIEKDTNTHSNSSVRWAWEVWYMENGYSHSIGTYNTKERAISECEEGVLKYFQRKYWYQEVCKKNE